MSENNQANNEDASSNSQRSLPGFVKANPTIFLILFSLIGIFFAMCFGAFAGAVNNTLLLQAKYVASVKLTVKNKTMLGLRFRKSIIQKKW